MTDANGSALTMQAAVKACCGVALTQVCHGLSQLMLCQDPHEPQRRLEPHEEGVIWRYTQQQLCTSSL